MSVANRRWHFLITVSNKIRNALKLYRPLMFGRHYDRLVKFTLTKE